MPLKTEEEKVTILIAENDEDHASLLNGYFDKSGLRNSLVWFHKGNELIEYFKAPEFDENGAYLLLLDAEMRCPEGGLVSDHIRSNDKLKNIPYLLMEDAGHANSESHHGDNCHFVVKPMNIKTFAEMIYKLGMNIIVVKP